MGENFAGGDFGGAQLEGKISGFKRAADLPAHIAHGRASDGEGGSVALSLADVLPGTDATKQTQVYRFIYGVPHHVGAASDSDSKPCDALCSTKKKQNKNKNKYIIRNKNINK